MHSRIVNVGGGEGMLECGIWGMAVEEFRIAQSIIQARQHHFVATTEKASRGDLCHDVLI